MLNTSIPTPLTMALDSSPVAMATIEGEHGKVAYSNASFDGIIAPTASGGGLYLAALDGPWEALNGIHKEALASGAPQTKPNLAVHGKWYQATATPLNGDGRTQYTFLTVTDITDSVKGLGESEGKARLYENALDNLCYSVSIISYPDLRVEFANKAICEYISKLENRSITPADLIGRSFRNSTSEATTHNPAYIAREVGKTRGQMDIEPACYVGEDGVQRFARVSYIPLETDGTVTHIVNAGVDVTDVLTAQHRIQERIRSHHEFLGRLLDTVDIAMFVVEYPSLDCAYANKRTLQLLNKLKGHFHTEADIGKLNLGSLFDMNCPTVASAIRAGLQESPTDRGVATVTMDGVKRHFRVLYTPMDSQSGVTHVAGLVMDVTDLLEAHLEVENLSKAKDDLLALVSHELRTPLTVMLGYLQLLKLHLHDYNEDKLLEAFDKILIHGKRMDRIIADLLDYSRLGSSSLEMDLTPLNLHDFIDYMVESYRVGCTSHEIVFGTPVPSVVLGDHLRLGQVIMNLFSNATRYSDAGTTITVGMDILSDKVRVSVSDQGWGIPEEALHKLFERYYRTDQSSLKIPGMGIGLYVASEIIKAHGGTLSVVSTLGKGSTFTVELPLAFGY